MHPKISGMLSYCMIVLNYIFLHSTAFPSFAFYDGMLQTSTTLISSQARSLAFHSDISKKFGPLVLHNAISSSGQRKDERSKSYYNEYEVCEMHDIIHIYISYS